ncbi:MAG: hypothetical protein HKO59_09530, partial [Phycisphaerales bacterium]|nr:hypothetical protein [Phycisphaerales bacterium]
IARVEEPWFEVALIPTTRALTTLGHAAVGAELNLETDCIARTVVTWLRQQWHRKAGGSEDR